MTDPVALAAPALRLDGLRKSFGATLAVDDVGLEVPAGSFYGLVGPNGAGKTTTLSMAVGLLRPDAGRASVYGVDVWDDPGAARVLMGVLPDGLSLPEKLTGREVLTYFGLLRGMDAPTVGTRVDDLLAVLDLRGAEETAVGDYSTGMRKKVGVAAALLHAPRLLVLDEPFEAVDPVSAATIRTMLLRVVRDGGSVVLSSHVMAVVEQVCDRVAVIADGRVVAAGGTEEVRAGGTLEDAFVRLVGGSASGADDLGWLGR